MTLKDRYEKICNEYIKIFSDKQDIQFDEWMGGIVGGVAGFISEYYFNFSDIVYDINSDQPKGLILRWQDDYLENVPNGRNINYYSYSKGLRYSDLQDYIQIT